MAHHLRVSYGTSAACERGSAHKRHAAQTRRCVDPSSPPRMHSLRSNVSRIPVATTIRSPQHQPSSRRQGTLSLNSNGRDNPETWGDSIDDWDNGPSTGSARGDGRRRASRPPPPPPPPPPPFPGQPGAPSSGEGIDVGTLLKMGALTLAAVTIIFALVTVAILSSGY